MGRRKVGKVGIDVEIVGEGAGVSFLSEKLGMEPERLLQVLSEELVDGVESAVHEERSERRLLRLTSGELDAETTEVVLRLRVPREGRRHLLADAVLDLLVGGKGTAVDVLGGAGEGGVSVAKKRLGDGGFVGEEGDLERVEGRLRGQYNLKSEGRKGTGRALARKSMAGERPTASTRYQRT
jgi:hypothetical protein